MAPKTGIAEPRSAVEISEGIALTRRLVGLAYERNRQSQIELDTAKIQLAELETELATRGIK